MTKLISEQRRCLPSGGFVRWGLVCAFGVLVIGGSRGVGQPREPAQGDNRGLIARVQELEAALKRLAPVGTIVAYGGSSPPDGWLICDGSEFDLTHHPEYTSLAAILGKTFDPARQKIKLPDLRGRTSIGAGAGPKLTERVLGGEGGEESHTLTLAEMPKHTHSLAAFLFPSNGSVQAAMGGQPHLAGTIGNCNPAGGDMPHNIMQPYTIVNYIIKY